MFLYKRLLKNSSGCYSGMAPAQLAFFPSRQGLRGAIFAEKVPNFNVGHGEQLNKTGRMCLIRLHRIKIHGEQFLIYVICTYSQEIHREHFCRISSCAQSRSTRGLWAQSKSNRGHVSPPFLCYNTDDDQPHLTHEHL